MTVRTEYSNAVENDLEDIRSLLKQNDLPFEDISAQTLDGFVVFRDASGKLVGTGGVERYEHDGLLRSVVVHESARGTGLGKLITAAVERRAQAAGINAIYLLTTTAAEFFPRMGYSVFSRNDVPEGLQRSAEFASLCPASAVCMHKQLG